MTIGADTPDELEFDPSDLNGDEDAEIPEGRRRVYTEQADPEIDSLYGKWQRGRLDIQPDFQRQFVWDSVKSSRLIESALLDIPIPVIYLSQETANIQAVIDCQQRLTAFFSFINGKFPDNRAFRLTGLKVLRKLNGKSFAALEAVLQDKVKYCSIRTITFGRESDPDLKFEIFERLNSGAVALNEQELRNCVYRGPYNTKLRTLAENQDFRYLLGMTAHDKRMRDVALVLCFAAFYHSTYLNYRPPMTRFLNNDMALHQHISVAQANELESAFKNALATIRSLFDRHAFKRYYRGTFNAPDGRWEPKKFNASLYDVLMYTFARADRIRVYQNLDLIREAFIHLMTTDDDFIAAIELSTSSLDAVTHRFDKWRMTLDRIIGPGREPRLFTRAFKQQLYDANPACELCGQHISSMEDAAVDHIEPYWRGGPTTPTNGRLAHHIATGPGHAATNGSYVSENAIHRVATGMGGAHLRVRHSQGNGSICDQRPLAVGPEVWECEQLMPAEIRLNIKRPIPRKMALESTRPEQHADSRRERENGWPQDELAARNDLLSAGRSATTRSWPFTPSSPW